MALGIGLMALLLSIVSIAYTVWLNSQETVDAGEAWGAKRQLEEAIVTHLRTLKAEWGMEGSLDENPTHGLFMARATVGLLQALERGRAAGLPRIMTHAQNGREDFLTEWIMLETHLTNNLAHRLPREEPSDGDDAAGSVELDPGKGVLMLGRVFLSHLAPLSRWRIRRLIREPLELSDVEREILDRLVEQSANENI